MRWVKSGQVRSGGWAHPLFISFSRGSCAPGTVDIRTVPHGAVQHQLGWQPELFMKRCGRAKCGRPPPERAALGGWALRPGGWAHCAQGGERSALSLCRLLLWARPHLKEMSLSLKILNQRISFVLLRSRPLTHAKNVQPLRAYENQCPPILTAPAMLI